MAARSLLPCLLLVAFLLPACRHRAAATTPRATPSQPAPEPSWYEADGSPPAPDSIETLWREDHNELLRVAVPARVPAELESLPHATDPIEILLLRPHPLGTRRRPLILMFPILNNSTLLMREFGSRFTRMGYVVAIVPRKELDFDPQKSIERAEQELRVLVMRGRQALDWLITQPAVDPKRIGFFGASAGGILGVSLMGADPRVKAGVFVFAGGPMADVMVDTSEGRFTENLALVRKERGWSEAEIRRRLGEIIRTDPIALAARVDRDAVLMFLATKDKSVPTRHQRALWEALGRPEKYELPGGHYTGFGAYLPFIVEKSARFLGKKLGR